jgi:hypothetical protein
MNNYDTIYVMLKKHCEEAANPTWVDYEKVETELHLYDQMNSLQQYLQVFHDLGLIKYSQAKRTIFLTEKGRVTKKLFTD